MDLKEVIKKLNKFSENREWKKFHNPKDLAISLTLEATEVLEHFQWKSKEEVEDYVMEHNDEISHEVADVAIYLLFLCEALGIDLLEAIEDKMKINEEHYPVAKAKGSNKKYTELN